MLTKILHGQSWRFCEGREHKENRDGGIATYWARPFFLMGPEDEATFFGIESVPAYVRKAFGIYYPLPNQTHTNITKGWGRAVRLEM